jgi:magnesium chelatase family protein
VPRPGEVSLAHHGVLFMDEFPEFRRSALEVLRQPLEEGEVTISRARASLTFPARFMLVAALNPCPCGYFGDLGRRCRCSHPQRRRYLARLSGPLLDRLDLRLSVPRLTPEELLKLPTGEGSEPVKGRVAAGRRRALERQGAANADLAGRSLRRHAPLVGDAEAFAGEAVRRLALSGRGFDRLLRVARTIADLAGREAIGAEHLAEAVGFRDAPGLEVF